ncbi:inositol monophosphatase family protein [Desulfoscipio geothermicus]|uniref:Inositol-1-monophosphatase n=1 Tax=Desulfoscipio geothermicus DSM 3669 TaxID=1121426 RepID=A0A1I6DI03_9FIRM|nr:inositol monophosphatase family protein [Desulfoscipio geothermicus]SFR05090.1 myo-inositol-1(or 4)-monophosphatase [Desulfoscipio geothermicus DSM 3669]
MHSYNAELALAVRAAREAGRLIREKINRHRVTETKSCLSDLVTEVDRLAEEVTLHMIRDRFPEHTVVGEEEQAGRAWETGKNLTWFVDPLDGTTNFVFGLPFCAVSIALAHRGRPVLGVIHDPFREETFTAVRGGGAHLNGAPVSVDRAICTLDRSLLVTGYPGNAAMRPRMHRVDYKEVIDRCSNLRALGSAALELAYVACGRLTGFWEVALRPWDVAAGMVLVEEAGGTVSDLAGQPLEMTEYVDIAASNGLIHREFLACLAWEDEK